MVGPAGHAGQQPEAKFADGKAFSAIRIDGGTIAVRDQSRGYTETFDKVEFSLAWPSISKSFGATGRFVWRNELVDASFTLSDFAAALAGSKSGLKLRFAGLPMKLAFDGTVSTGPTLRVEGTLAADATSLREALRWTGQQPLPGGGFGRFAIKAQTNVVGGTIGLSGVNVELDGNTAEGVLTFATDGRQTLQGTLAADTLDLSPYVSTVRLLTANQREWNNARITLDGLSGIDLDLRLSAANVVMSNAKLGRTAIGANLRGGHLVVTVGEAQAYGGVIKGSLTLANFDTGVDVKSQLQFTDVDLESCLGQLFGLRRLEGKGNLSFAVEGTGESVLGLTRTLSGSASLSGQKGTLAGLNVEQLLRRWSGGHCRAAANSAPGARPWRPDRGHFEDFPGQGDGRRRQDRRILYSPRAGRLGLDPSRELDLKGTASLDRQRQRSGFELPFIVQGSWDDPDHAADAQS